MTSSKPVALVAGASAGIGRATALALVDAGFAVVATARTTPRLPPADGVSYLDLDVTDDASVASVLTEVIDRHGRIDLLVNNAGIGSAGAAEESTIAHDRAVFDVNVFGIMRMTKAVLPHMRARRSGRIVNVSSVLGLIPQPFMAAYSASKHAVEGYSESVDHEVRDLGVRVLLVEPAVTKTNFDAARNHGDPVPSLPAYAKQRKQTDDALAGAAAEGDPPEAVAAAIVAAATDAKPKLRYTPAKQAGRISALRRFAPRRIVDRQIRSFNGF